jgi:hypothetical protein
MMEASKPKRTRKRPAGIQSRKLSLARGKSR